MLERLKKLSFKFFGNSLERFVPYFDSIKSDLQQADLGLSLAEYIYIMFFVILIAFVIELPAIVILTSLFFKSVAPAFLFALTSTVLILVAIFFGFYTYPSLLANSRKRSINSSLPFATTYMATIASSGAPPPTIFRVLGNFKEYGELSREAAKISRDVDAFGMDLKTSIRKTANRSPSNEFRELLWGMDAVISIGGNLSNYLHEKSQLFMQEYRRNLQRYAQTLSLFIEVYLTLVIVGSIFFIILSAIMSIFGAGNLSLLLTFGQFVVVFIMLPTISIGLIYAVRYISPGASK